MATEVGLEHIMDPTRAGVSREEGAGGGSPEQRSRLPIARCRKALVDAVLSSSCLVVVGETGSGKTTQLPQYLHEAGLTRHGPIVITQPRRVAAISVAERVAEEMGVNLGAEVGYHVRFDHKCSDKTVLKFVTDGTLLRECLEDRSLSAYSAVILDEAHIRSMDTDILFGLLKTLLSGDDASGSKTAHRKLARIGTKLSDGRDEDVTTEAAVDDAHTRSVEAGSSGPGKSPKIVIMSATLQSERLGTFFNCKAFHIPGRVYPVSMRYCNLVDEDDYRNVAGKAVETALRIHRHKPRGDILVFLTGRAEIERACDELFRASETIDYRRDVTAPDIEGLMVLPVYGSMATAAQRQIFAPAPAGVRKVVVATDIASTSLTIDGIVYVVDGGFVKQKMFNPRTGLDALQVVPIAKSEATQRAGRAGRTKPGICYKLYSAEFEEAMDAFTTPEIQRTSLTAVVLTLKVLGINDVLRFRYLDPPEELLLLEALRQLYYFDAIDRRGIVTPLGHSMAALPLSPAQSRVLLHAMDGPTREPVLRVVAMLSVENVFVRPGNPRALARAEEAKTQLETVGGDDFCTLLHVYNLAEEAARRGRDALHRWCKQHFVHFRAASTALKVRDQLDGILTRLAHANGAGPSADPPGKGHGVEGPVQITAETSSAVRAALCQGFFPNIARRAESGNYFRTMEGRASVVAVHPSSAMFDRQDDLNWVIFLEVVWTTKPYMRCVCPVEYAWVRHLLPKLHEVEVHMLSGRGEVEEGLSDPKPLASATDTSAAAATADQAKRKTTERDVDDARKRYLARKRAREERLESSQP